MATQCRETKQKHINQNKFVNCYAYGVIAVLVLIGTVAGYYVGKSFAPKETVTMSQIVEVPATELPETVNPYIYGIPMSTHLQAYLQEVCAEEGVPVTLVLALIEHESNFDAEAHSETADYGLMQINMVANSEWLAEEYRCADLLNPYQNIFCGVKILSGLCEKYENDYNKVLMAYNMGDYGARKAWDSGMETSHYSTSILELMDSYEEESREFSKQ